MCQVCAVKQIATRERWPKPLEASKNDACFVVNTIHDEWEIYSKSLETVPVPNEILDLLRLLAESLEALEEERSVWWKSPEKRALRKRLEDGGEQRKLSDLYVSLEGVPSSRSLTEARA